MGCPLLCNKLKEAAVHSQRTRSVTERGKGSRLQLLTFPLLLNSKKCSSSSSSSFPVTFEKWNTTAKSNRRSSALEESLPTEVHETKELPSSIQFGRLTIGDVCKLRSFALRKTSTVVRNPQISDGAVPCVCYIEARMMGSSWYSQSLLSLIKCHPDCGLLYTGHRSTT